MNKTSEELWDIPDQELLELWSEVGMPIEPHGEGWKVVSGKRLDKYLEKLKYEQ